MKPRLWLAVLMLCTPAFGHRRLPRHQPPAVKLFKTEGSLLAQNAAADRMRLPRVRNRAMLSELVGDGSLAPLPLGRCLKSSVARWRAFLTPFASGQLADIADAFCVAFEKPLRVDSAIRPLDVQQRLRRLIGRTAAPVSGPTASVHPTGAAFDLQRRGLTKTQLRWLEWRLFYLQAAGWVIVEEERACFHVVSLRDHDGSLIQKAEVVRHDSTFHDDQNSHRDALSFIVARVMQSVRQTDTSTEP